MTVWGRWNRGKLFDCSLHRVDSGDSVLLDAIGVDCVRCYRKTITLLPLRFAVSFNGIVEDRIRCQDIRF